MRKKKDETYTMRQQTKYKQFVYNNDIQFKCFYEDVMHLMLQYNHMNTP